MASPGRGFEFRKSSYVKIVTHSFERGDQQLFLFHQLTGFSIPLKHPFYLLAWEQLDKMDWKSLFKTTPLPGIRSFLNALKKYAFIVPQGEKHDWKPLLAFY